MIKHIRTAADLKDVADRLGSTMFAPATMKWWGSRLLGTIYPVVTNTEDAFGYFVTSERPNEEPRRYSVRSYSVVTDGNDQSILFDTIHWALPSRNEAIRAAKEHHALLSE